MLGAGAAGRSRSRREPAGAGSRSRQNRAAPQHCLGPIRAALTSQDLSSDTKSAPTQSREKLPLNIQ